MNRVDCQEAMTHLQDYLKQELTPDLAAEIHRHLDRCRDCFSYAQFEATFIRILETRGRRETCPGELRARIEAALRAEARRD